MNDTRSPPRILILAGLVLLACLLMAPPGALAEQTVGLILPGGEYFGEDTKQRFTGYLQEEGFSPDAVKVYLQRPSADKVSRINAIRKFLAYEMDVLVIFGASAAREAAGETGKTPIVFMGARDPVKQGLVKDLKKPGRNVTGVSGKTSTSFLLDNIQEIAGPITLGVIHRSDSLDSASDLKEIQDLASKRGLKTIVMDTVSSTTEEMAAAFGPSDFVYLVVGSYPLVEGECSVIDIGKPVASQSTCDHGSGIVLALVPDFDELLKEGARTAARILKGEKPGEMAVTSVKKISFIINLPEAKKFDLQIPFPVLSRASEVVK